MSHNIAPEFDIFLMLQKQNLSLAKPNSFCIRVHSRKGSNAHIISSLSQSHSRNERRRGMLIPTWRALLHPGARICAIYAN